MIQRRIEDLSIQRKQREKERIHEKFMLGQLDSNPQIYKFDFAKTQTLYNVSIENQRKSQIAMQTKRIEAYRKRLKSL